MSEAPRKPYILVPIIETMTFPLQAGQFWQRIEEWPLPNFIEGGGYGYFDGWSTYKLGGSRAYAGDARTMERVRQKNPGTFASWDAVGVHQITHIAELDEACIVSKQADVLAGVARFVNNLRGGYIGVVMAYPTACSVLTQHAEPNLEKGLIPNAGYVVYPRGSVTGAQPGVEMVVTPDSTPITRPQFERVKHQQESSRPRYF